MPNAPMTKADLEAAIAPLMKPMRINLLIQKLFTALILCLAVVVMDLAIVDRLSH
jgi:hypothetical protein